MATSSSANLPKREELSPDQTWDLESVFATREEWEAEFSRVATRLDEPEPYRGQLSSSPQSLLAALQLRDSISEEVDRVAVYAFLRLSEDATSDSANAMANRAAGLAARAGAATAFIDPEILSINSDLLEGYIEIEPALNIYRHYFDKLHLMRDHTRSSDVEELLARSEDMTSNFYSIRSALENADLDLGTITDSDGSAVELGQGNLMHFLASEDRVLREQVWTQAADAYVRMKNTFGTALAGGIKSDVFYMQARKFDSSLEAALSPNAIPTEVFHNLVDTVWQNLPTWHKYFQIRRRVLGVDRLEEWDIFAPLLSDSRDIPFADGVDMILDGLTPLGDEYVEIVRQGIADRWVDPYPNVGKGGGAFSGGAKGTLPFISMSYQNNIQSVSILTHELGHSMHSYYTWENQPQIYSNYSMFVAESASNMHQALLGHKLFAEVDDPAFLIEIIEERMANHLRYFFTMPILARFELETHERSERGEALTADGMTTILADLYEEGYGGEVEVDRERMGITWARFPHLFAGFYVFQYATGISAAAEMAKQVIAEGEPARQRYIDFLKTGDSKYPIDALRDAGVDMLDPAPVQAAFDILAGYVERLDELTR